MKSFGRYFVYRLKQSTLRTLVFTLLSLVFCLNVVGESQKAQMIANRESGIYMLALILGIFSTLIPILELSGFKNRRNLDTLYFFPIKRTKMALAHYLSGACQVFVIYTVSFLSVWIYLLAKTDWYRLAYMPLYYLFSILLGAVMYSIFAFLFSEANTVADGVLFCGLWIFLIALVIFVARSYFARPFIIDTEYWIESSNLSAWGIIYTPINNLTVIFQDLIEVNLRNQPHAPYPIYSEQYMSQMYMFFLWGAVGIAAAAGYFVRFKRKGAEMAGEPSDSPFGYRLLIPLYGYTLLFMYSELDIMTIIIFALMLIGYFIYRRGFKLRKRDIVYIVCGVLPMILASILNYNYLR